MHCTPKNNQLSALYRLFYTLKPIIPRPLQLFVRRRVIQHQRPRCTHVWPIDPAAVQPPPDWRGWPDHKQFALVLSHDVDTQFGHDKCRRLMDLEEELGFRSTFNLVAEKYRISSALLDEIKARGFGLGVHGLKHDGKLFLSRKIFQKRAQRINRYLAEWGTKGFSSPSMHRNLEWMHALNIDYATSTFDTDPFEPQPCGVRTIFPFLVNSGPRNHRYVELPYTLPQDFTLFILMRENTNAIWKTKLNWIARHHGMVLLNTHPDYMNFNGRKHAAEEYSAQLYKSFLAWIGQNHTDQHWHALPAEVALYITSLWSTP
jgi:peptidoglycan/xylan/chitin deacetylase (PgdA/CDA1 family)